MRGGRLVRFDESAIDKGPAGVCDGPPRPCWRGALPEVQSFDSDPDPYGAVAGCVVGAGGAASVEWTGEQLGNLPPHGLAHIAFTYDTLEDLLANYERLKAEAILPTVTINHGTTTSMYFVDPDGNQIELQVDNFATAAEGTEFMESQSFRTNPVGVPFDADDLVEKLQSGVSARELMAPSW